MKILEGACLSIEGITVVGELIDENGFIVNKIQKTFKEIDEEFDKFQNELENKGYYIHYE